VVQAVDGAGSVNRRECFPQLFPRRESSVTVAERTRNEEAASEGSADVEFLALQAQMAVFAREISQLYKAERLRSRELELALAGARETYVATMKSLAQVVEAKDATTRGHLDRTQAYGLALARRVVEGDRVVRSGEFSGWEPDLLLGSDLKGKIFGVVGPGRIGRAVARRARAFGMTVIACGRSPRDEDDPDDPPRVSFDELLRRSDVVSIHLPLNEETRHFFNAETFAKMKAGSWLLNTSRGAIVDEAALARALAKGLPAGAGLDVFENEPGVTAALLESDRVVLTPHVGSATHETRREMARMVVEDVRRVLTGEKPLRAVPPESNRERMRAEL